VRVYHTCASQPDVQKARSVAPSVEHGTAAIPRRLSHTPPWFLDNGAYRAWVAGEEWDSEAFVDALGRADDPEFVVVPDSPGDAAATAERASGWVEKIVQFGHTPYGVIQPGNIRSQFDQLAEECEGVLVGGGGGANARRDWRRAPYEDGRPAISHVCDEAEKRGLGVHVGRPGRNLGWWAEHPIDSVDTASIVRNGYWSRLRQLEDCSTDGLGAYLDEVEP
jgi:hypothetical protein